MINILAAKRQDLILALINEKGFIKIKEIENQFSISKMTALRDLKALEEKGFINKVHGGAMKKDISQYEPSFEEKDATASKEKEVIAKYAAENVINESDIISLGAGSTITKIIPYLKQKNLTILTNGLKTIVNIAKYGPHFTLMGSGGELRKPAMIFVGPEAENFFKRNKADTVILSGTGLTIKDGITDPDPLDAEVKKVMCENAKKVIFLMDSTKIDNVSLVSMMELKNIDLLIIDDKVPEAFIKKLKNNNINFKIVK